MANTEFLPGPEHLSDILIGYAIDEDVFDAFVDDNVDYIVFIDPNRARYSSTVDDWLDYGTRTDGCIHLGQSRMSRG